jgi:hypothetical protein
MLTNTILDDSAKRNSYSLNSIEMRERERERVIMREQQTFREWESE